MLEKSPKRPKELKEGGQFTAPISDELFKLFNSPESVSSVLAQDPTISPEDAWKKLYGQYAGKPKGPRSIHHAGKHAPLDEYGLRTAAESGNWGPTKPSKLFLQMYHDAINSLEENPGHAVVSPSLMGSCGVLPLTIISTIPDIVRHMSNCIVRAESEVFLATNFWANSTASKFITDAMRELSRRCGDRGTRIVFKIIYDRGSPKQLIKPHYLVSEKEYTSDKVNIPKPEEIPNIDLQVMNYHHPLLGTFHAKYMVVDRKVAILQSNNIQDNENLEMMVHMEGPIVDSMYDMALISWHKRLEPPLPSHNSPATQGGISCFSESHASIFQPNGSIQRHTAVVDPSKAAPREAYGYTPRALQPGHDEGNQTQVQNDDDAARADIASGPSTTENVVPEPQHTLSLNSHQTATGQPHISNAASAPDRATAEYLGKGDAISPHVPLPTAKVESLPEHTTDDPHWDDNIANEILRIQASVSAKHGETAIQAVNRHLNHTINVGFPSTAPECASEDEITPYIPHTVHEPFPIAMVNRPPYGTPNHKSVSVPQNAAWLSALRNAQKNVFIQTPTLNAEPLVPAIVEACERGVDVYCYVCLGYNDVGELLPMQGGHNDMVAHRLYTALSASAAARARLHYFWYVAKDQTAPLVQAKRRRSCHIKLLIADEQVGVIGNGNQDTQSWFHSQEANVMVDSAAVCRAWVAGLRRGQNTHAYGALDKERGIWTDARGAMADGAIGVDPGRFAWARGVVGAVKRVQGVGGF